MHANIDEDRTFSTRSKNMSIVITFVSRQVGIAIQNQREPFAADCGNIHVISF